MKSDPTHTKMLRISYEKMLTRRFKQFIHNVIPMLKPVIKQEQNRFYTFTTRQMEGIIDYELYYTVENHLNIDIERYLNQGYTRGMNNAVKDIKKASHGALVPSEYLTPLDMEAMNILRDNNVALVKNVGMDARKTIVRIINEGLLQGQGIDKIARNIRKTTTAMTINRSKIIARTEIIRSYNQASINRYKNNGIKKYQWLTAFDDRTCDDCAGLDGSMHPVDGGVRPHLHPNCRCTVIPVIGKI